MKKKIRELIVKYENEVNQLLLDITDEEFFEQCESIDAQYCTMKKVIEDLERLL